MALDRVNHFLQLKPESFRLHHEPVHLIAQKPFPVASPGRRKRRDDGSHTWPGLEEPLLNQVLNHFVRRIGVYLQFGRQNPNRRERLSREELAANQGSFRGKDDLIKNGLSRAQIESEQCHINNVTDRTPHVKQELRDPQVEIVSLILEDVIGLMSEGLIAGFAGALAILTVFKSVLFGVRTADPTVTGTAIGLFFVIGFFAATIPAHRAATIDPLLALREE